MIQRIQTIYILIAGVLIASLLKLKLADIAVNDDLMELLSTGIMKGEDIVYNGLPIFILISIITLLHVAAVLLYKRRIIQIRILVFTIILLLGLFGLIFYFTYSGFKDAEVAFKIPVAFPIVAIILDWLAIRSIGRDEALVRSLDRIR